MLVDRCEKKAEASGKCQFVIKCHVTRSPSKIGALKHAQSEHPKELFTPYRAQKKLTSQSHHEQFNGCSPYKPIRNQAKVMGKERMACDKLISQSHDELFIGCINKGGILHTK